MELAKFFTSLLWGSILVMPLMILVSKEVEGFEKMDMYLWIPIILAVLSLAIKSILEKKNNRRPDDQLNRKL